MSPFHKCVAVLLLFSLLHNLINLRISWRNLTFYHMWYHQTNMKMFDVFGLVLAIFGILSGGLLLVTICTNVFQEAHEKRYLAIPFVIAQLFSVIEDVTFVINFWDAEQYTGVETPLKWKGLETILCGVALRAILILVCILFV